MPKISEFYGVRIRMYVKDHPPPHFHAFYGEDEALVSIKDGRVLVGKLPPTASRLVRRWAIAHHSALTHNWERAQNSEALLQIEGLDAHQSD